MSLQEDVSQKKGCVIDIPLYLKRVELSLNWGYDWHSRTTKVGISEKRRRDNRHNTLQRSEGRIYYTYE